MYNRRDNHRHSFSRGEGLLAQIRVSDCLTPVPGEIVSLSAGGVGIEVWDEVAKPLHRLHALDRISIRFSLPDPETSLHVIAQVRHLHKTDVGTYYGLQLQSFSDPATNTAREEAIWNYLVKIEGRSKLRVVG
jgi:hypothetical protein